eukprot:jgi/Mesen1/9581/ME000653S08918
MPLATAPAMACVSDLTTVRATKGSHSSGAALTVLLAACRTDASPPLLGGAERQLILAHVLLIANRSARRRAPSAAPTRSRTSQARARMPALDSRNSTTSAVAATSARRSKEPRRLPALRLSGAELPCRALLMSRGGGALQGAEGADDHGVVSWQAEIEAVHVRRQEAERDKVVRQALRVAVHVVHQLQGQQHHGCDPCHRATQMSTERTNDTCSSKCKLIRLRLRLRLRDGGKGSGKGSRRGWDVMTGQEREGAGGGGGGGGEWTDGADEADAIRGLHLAHHAEVKVGQLAVLGDQQVAGVRVRVEEALLQQLPQRAQHPLQGAARAYRATDETEGEEEQRGRQEETRREQGKVAHPPDTSNGARAHCRQLFILLSGPPCTRQEKGDTAGEGKRGGEAEGEEEGGEEGGANQVHELPSVELCRLQRLAEERREEQTDRESRGKGQQVQSRAEQGGGEGGSARASMVSTLRVVALHRKRQHAQQVRVQRQPSRQARPLHLHRHRLPPALHHHHHQQQQQQAAANGMAKCQDSQPLRANLAEGGGGHGLLRDLGKEVAGGRAQLLAYEAHGHGCRERRDLVLQLRQLLAVDRWQHWNKKASIAQLSNCAIPAAAGVRYWDGRTCARLEETATTLAAVAAAGGREGGGASEDAADVGLLRDCPPPMEAAGGPKADMMRWQVYSKRP